MIDIILQKNLTLVCLYDYESQTGNFHLLAKPDVSMCDDPCFLSLREHVL